MSNEVKLPLKAVVKAVEKAVSAKPDPVYVSLEKRKAFTVERGPGGWVFVTITYTDDGVVESIQKSQPDIKPITLEHFKIAALKYWTSIG